MVNVKIGCSGFMYDHWRGIFYPQDVTKKQWFHFYTGIFDTVEMNVTFYRLLKEEAFIKWYNESPEKYSFSIKGSRYITHVKRLMDSEDALKRLFERAFQLKDKLSVVLWQLPPNMKHEHERLKAFLRLLRNYRIRHTFEFRHQSWIIPEVVDALKGEGHAFCMADWPVFNDELPVTADFVYLRRHGQGGNYDTCYSRRELEHDAKRIRRYIKKGLDVYIYFNNDALGYAPKNAMELKEML